MTYPLDNDAITTLATTIRLDDPHFISGYGNVAAAGTDIGAISDLMEQSPISLLAGKIADVVARLGEADPKRLDQKKGWFARFTGAELETTVRFDAARKSLDRLLEEAERHASHVQDMMRKIDTMIETQAASTEQLTVAIAAGRLYLEQNPEAGKPDAGKLQFDNQRERFARRLTNMSTLLASTEMSVAQLRLTRAQGFDLLDRFSDVSQVLIPVWRQHALSLAQSKNNPEMIAAANQAHEALMKSLVAMSGGTSR